MQPEPYAAGIFPPGTLSANDIAGVKSFYPEKSKAVTVKKGELYPIKAKPGKQDDFIFKATSTKKYTFQTIGQLDTVMVISEIGKTENHYLAGDDDSGTDNNSKITLPLVKGRQYLINIRVLYAADAQSGSITVS